MWPTAISARRTGSTDAWGRYRIALPDGAYVLHHFETNASTTLQAPDKFEFEVRPDEPVRHDLLFRRRLDWGDAPDTPYPTLAASNGARHLVLPGYSLGARVDPEGNGQANGDATGDDIGAPGDDEDGVTFLTPLIGGSPATVQVDFTSTMGLTGVLDAWIDFNADGDWNSGAG